MTDPDPVRLPVGRPPEPVEALREALGVVGDYRREVTAGTSDDPRVAAIERRCEQAIAALSRVPQGRDAWQSIETAPKMRTILLWAATDVSADGTIHNWKMATGSWHTGYEDERARAIGFTPWTWDGVQLRDYEVQPTHWAPLPAPPASADETPQ